MKVGIAGFSVSGKSTVFEWLTGAKPDPSKAQFGQIGVATVPDERVDWLSAHFKPKKTTHAKLELLDTPGLMPSERKDNPRRLGIMRDANGLLIVLNGYGEGDLPGQLRRFREEMLFADLEIVANRIGKLEDNLKKPRPQKQKEQDQIELALLKRIQTALESGGNTRQLGLMGDEEKMVRSFQLLTLKPELVLVNGTENTVSQALPAELLTLAPTAVQPAPRLEMELLELSDEDRRTFMQDLGLTDFKRDSTVRAIFAAMGQIVFFTVGEDECRAWPIPHHATAVEGAGEIHTDLSKGFVRAEVVSYDDFRKVGSMKEAKAKGVYRLEGKTYEVKDGDIMHILHS
jgi:ribosome-binding ATPase YchF (GTP1/OBG family)